MNEALKAKIIKRNAFLWGGAFITPPLIMVIVDATTRETPSQNMIAIFSTMVLMILFVLNHAMLSSALQSVPGSGGESDETSS